MQAVFLPALLFSLLSSTHALINRQALVTHFNPSRTSSSPITPMQVGNGNFAFGADITGLQTFLPYAIFTSWGWKNDSLPPGKTQADVDVYRGAEWLNHGRPVRYDFGGDPAVQQWLIANPNRVNLGRVGLVFFDEAAGRRNVTEDDLQDKKQVLDLWTGNLSSTFVWEGEGVEVRTVASQSSSSVGVTISSSLIGRGRLGLFVDFPWNDGSSMFSAPFVGRWDMGDRHTTTLNVPNTTGEETVRARITHQMDSAIFYTSIGGTPFSITRDSPSSHRYTLLPNLTTPQSQFQVVIDFSPTTSTHRLPSVSNLTAASDRTWIDYWTKTGFVDMLTGSTDPRAEELQRRIILSRYLMRVNEAGDTPPQESGLVNNGWYGKFHMEMVFWHSAHWVLWSNPLLSSAYATYTSFLPSSLARAQTQQGFTAGARWPKMTDPSGRSTPGEINNLLVWQQPHPIVFALNERRAVLASSSSPTSELAVLRKWAPIIRATADFMAAFAFPNTSTHVYDLGPPLYVVSEDTAPNATQNPAFELAYWRFGLGAAREWLTALSEPVPAAWVEVENNLAPLPLGEDGLYQVYEGIEGTFWTDKRYVNDHPSLVGLHGWLPPTPGLNLTTARLTAENVWTHWNISNCWGWDFPLLALSAARNDNPSQALDWLLHPLFAFDDVGMPLGGARVPTPYFPGSGALLYAVAMMARGWDGSTGEAPGFPRSGWRVKAEGLLPAL